MVKALLSAREVLGSIPGWGKFDIFVLSRRYAAEMDRYSLHAAAYYLEHNEDLIFLAGCYDA